MPTERRRQIVLGFLLVALAALVYRALQPTAATSVGASNVRAGRQGDAAPPDVAPDVQLEMLDRERVQPGGGNRNLFRFQTRAESAPASAPAVARPPSTPVASGPPAAPGVPPIALKFIGVVEPEGPAARIAVLSDARGVVHGREGEVILGQYRILRIGPDSIDIAHLDGRGRQTIRLNGS